jgi:hypothetical protein
VRQLLVRGSEIGQHLLHYVGGLYERARTDAGFVVLGQCVYAVAIARNEAHEQAPEVAYPRKLVIV